MIISGFSFCINFVHASNTLFSSLYVSITAPGTSVHVSNAIQ